MSSKFWYKMSRYNHKIFVNSASSTTTLSFSSNASSRCFLRSTALSLSLSHTTVLTFVKERFNISRDVCDRDTRVRWSTVIPIFAYQEQVLNVTRVWIFLRNFQTRKSDIKKYSRSTYSNQFVKNKTNTIYSLSTRFGRKNNE